jgi:Amt family ammonium transporter
MADYLNAFLGGKIPALDFAGGTVVHISSGFSALVCAIYLGKRLGYPKTQMMPHNLVLSVIGACLLWVGWFGFNAGSAVAANGLAANAFVTTHFGAAAAALGWLTDSNGFGSVNRRFWVASRERSPGWSASRRRPVS